MFLYVHGLVTFL